MDTTPSIPTLSPEDISLFELYAQLRFDLHALAEQTGRGLVELLGWALSPPIQALMDALEFLAQRVVRLAALKARPVALDALRRLAQTVQNEKERRLAAAVLERASRPPRAQPARRAVPSDDPAAEAEHQHHDASHPSPLAAPADQPCADANLSEHAPPMALGGESGSPPGPTCQVPGTRDPDGPSPALNPEALRPDESPQFREAA